MNRFSEIISFFKVINCLKYLGHEHDLLAIKMPASPLDNVRPHSGKKKILDKQCSNNWLSTKYGRVSSRSKHSPARFLKGF